MPPTFFPPLWSLIVPFHTPLSIIIFVSAVFFCIIPSKLGHLQNCFQLHVSLAHWCPPLRLWTKKPTDLVPKNARDIFFFYFNERKTTRLSLFDTPPPQPKKHVILCSTSGKLRSVVLRKLCGRLKLCGREWTNIRFETFWQKFWNTVTFACRSVQFYW